jgi:hypothetical protein
MNFQQPNVSLTFHILAIVSFLIEARMQFPHIGNKHVRAEVTTIKSPVIRGMSLEVIHIPDMEKSKVTGILQANVFATPMVVGASNMKTVSSCRFDKKLTSHSSSCSFCLQLRLRSSK